MSSYSHTDSRGMSSTELLGRKSQRMSLEIPKDLHAEFKLAATMEGRYIRDIIVDLMEDYLRQKGYTRNK